MCLSRDSRRLHQKCTEIIRKTYQIFRQGIDRNYFLSFFLYIDTDSAGIEPARTY